MKDILANCILETSERGTKAVLVRSVMGHVCTTTHHCSGDGKICQPELTRYIVIKM